MKNREKKTAEVFGVVEKVQAFEQALLSIEGVFGDHVPFDLDGFYSNIRQVIIVPRYDIPMEGFFDKRCALKKEINATAARFGLYPSGDAIEDYGEHLYFVFECDHSWP